MMMGTGQLGLLLWKNYVVRKRQPAILGLLFVWPIVIFLLLYTLRKNVDTEDNSTCQFPARIMPRDGLLPFAQSFICSIGNTCDSLDNYEVIPSYKKAKLGPLMMELQPVINNQSILSAVDSLPNSVRMLKSMAEILTKPELKKIFVDGLQLRDLFNNPDVLKELIKEQLPGIKGDLIDNLFNASINLANIIDPVGSWKIDQVVFSPDTLKKFLVPPKETDLPELSRVLRDVDTSRIPDIFQHISQNLDWSKLFEVVSQIILTLENYDFIDDVTKVITTILNFNTIKEYVPNYLKLREWIPEILSIFKNMNWKKMDLTLINKTIKKMDSVLDGNHDWPIAQHSFHKLKSLLEQIKEIEVTRNNIHSDQSSMITLGQRTLDGMKQFSIDKRTFKDENFIWIHGRETEFTEKFQDLHEDEIELATKNFDNLKKGIFSEKILNVLSYFISTLDNVFQVIHHMVSTNEELKEKILNVTKIHEKVINNILTEVDPEVYEIFIKSFLRIDVAENLVKLLREKIIAEALCTDKLFNSIFQKDAKKPEVLRYSLICSDESKKFLTDIYNSFDFESFQKIIEKTLLTFNSMVLFQQIPIEKSNLTMCVKNIRGFFDYLKNHKSHPLDWSHLDLDEKWKQMFQETRIESKKAIFGYHLSIIKFVGIKSDLGHLNLITEKILKNLEENSRKWINPIRPYELELLETVYLTISDRHKVLKILEYSNFTRTYCDYKNPPELINYPSRSNKTSLKEKVCYVLRNVLMELDTNISKLEILDKKIGVQNSFTAENWTALDEKLMEIYEYIEKMMLSNDNENIYPHNHLEELKKKLTKAWLTDFTSEDILQISVGLLCKFFNIAESSLFNIRSTSLWNNFSALAWSALTIADNIENALDDILKLNSTERLAQIIKNLPETQIFLDIILQNLPEIIQDIGDILKQKEPTQYINVVNSSKKNESNDFIKEWKDNKIELVVPFNWTFGYTKFRGLVNKFIILKNDKVMMHPKTIIPKLNFFFNDYGTEDRMNIFLDYIDKKIDDNIPELKTNMTAQQVWITVGKTRGVDEMLVMAKFLSKVLYDAVNVGLKLLNNEGKNIDLISVLGFPQESPISILYHRLPYILATIINGISDPNLSNQIYENFETHETTCSQIFAWFLRYKLVLTSKEFNILSNFVCNRNYKSFNVFFDLYSDSSLIWKTSVAEYQSHFSSLTKGINEFANEIEKISNGTKKVIPFLHDDYFNEVINTMKTALEDSNSSIPYSNKSKFESRWATYDLIIGGLSEILFNAASALNENKLKKNELFVWDMIKFGDVHQLLKYLETYPVETISLVATLATVNASTNSFTPFNELRHTICNLRLNHSDFWNKPHRMHFLNSLCTYDPYELLSSATSKEYVNFIIGKHKSLRHEKPLSQSLKKFLDALANVNNMPHKKITFKSNIFNMTVWINLPLESKDLIHHAEKSWLLKLIHQYTLKHDRIEIDGSNDDLLTTVQRMFQISEIWFDIISSGDIWKKLRTRTIENYKLKILLNLIEDMPDLFVSTIDTFLYSERLNDFMSKFLAGQVNGCDIDKYLIPSLYIQKKRIITSITNFCHYIVLSKNNSPNSTNLSDYFQPLVLSENKNSIDIKLKKYEEQIKNQFSLNKTYFINQFEIFQSTLIRILSNGIEEPNIPTWWLSFQKTTLNNFEKQFKKKDYRTLVHSIISKSIKILKEMLLSTPKLRNSCSWCNTRVIEIFNSQLMNHRVYTEILCNFHQMNDSQIQDFIDKKLYWKKTFGMIKNYEFLREKKDVESFMTAVQDTLHYITDIFIDYHNKNENKDKNFKSCMMNAVKNIQFFSSNVYIKFAIVIVDALKKNVNILDTAGNHEILLNYSRITEKSIPIWIPLKNIVKKSTLDEVEKSLSNVKINVNLLLHKKFYFSCAEQNNCNNVTALNSFLASKQSYKLIKYDPIVVNYFSTLEISNFLMKSLDFQLINREISTWRRNSSSSLAWLEELLNHLSIILYKSMSILKIIDNIDFTDMSNVLNTADVADNFVNIIRNQTIDNLFLALRDILEDLEPFLTSKSFKNDLNLMVDSLESMEIFKNIYLLDMNYTVPDIFLDWNNMKDFLIQDVNISSKAVTTLNQSRVNMLSVIRKKRSIDSLKETFCSVDNLRDTLNFNGTNTTAEEISNALCSLDSGAMQNITQTLIRNVNFTFILKIVLTTNMNSIIRNADLTESEANIIFDNIKVVEEIVPFFQKKLAVGLFIHLPADTSSSSSKMSSGQFIQDASKLICGRELISDEGQFYRIMSSLEDNNKMFDEMELNSLPSDFCRNIYKNVLGMSGGKIIWSYVKPLLRGRILYAPKSNVIKKVMSLANQTFFELGKFKNMMLNLEKTLVGLANLSDMEDKLKTLQKVMQSETMKVAIKAMSQGRYQGDFFTNDFSDVAYVLKKSTKVIKMIEMLNNFLECILADRMFGFETEDELEIEARKLTDTNEFLAGVVFLDSNSNLNREKRSIVDDKLQVNVTYKIRMDVDFVPSTKRVKNQFWLPGPEASFMEDLRYLRGFIQLQDSIDRAIIEVKSGKSHNWKTISQQMPYPCWKREPFQSTLYESQGLILCFFFAMMLCVGSAVRHVVWERESQNAMVMSVMGLKPWRNTFAWFITSTIEITIVAVSICTILIVGKILPNSDPFVLMILLLDYVFSIVTFCYMISTVFSSASLAAITTVVMFLLTFIPYIIVISMQATWHGTIRLGYNLILCLSMSTSFCYGLLYAARREVQGTGLTWDTVWDRTSSHDQMSLGLVLLMIALDGCFYALIGYLIDRYTNSGKGCHGLRSRSLWWANAHVLNGRPSYLAFVNDLYFTNDVLHPSSTYQDEDSDSSSVIVNEKQVGVRFEGVRKIFNSGYKEVIAVADFTLKLREGEVTSLLGRNGAGKTTIIKMLTGMMTPTSGEIYLNGEEGMKPNIGVCPQENVLIENLTPREHMNFYAILKRSMNNEEMDKNVNKMLVSLELGHQEHEPVSRLSGGTKRRLCVALAFLGSPNLVILDEPGAGVDPAARRRIWRLIDQHRVNRTILLSTHHLDEADMLSDNVVVMHKGKILCTGSPLTLKKTYGKGYWINLAFPYNEINQNEISKNIENIKSLIEIVASNAKSDVDQSSGLEVSVNIPFHGKNGIKNDIAGVLKKLEDNKDNLNFSRISLECDTLERVFLNLCSKADRRETVNGERSTSVESVGVNINDNIQPTTTESVLRRSPWRQAKALLKKRLWHFAKDWRAPLATLILPTIFVAVAMGFSLVRPPSGDEPPLQLNPKLYSEHSTYFYTIDNISDSFLQHVSLQLRHEFSHGNASTWQIYPNDTGLCECIESQQVCYERSKAVEGLVQTLPGRSSLDWIVSTFHEYIEKRYGGWSMSHLKEDPLFVVWFNNKGYHSLPAFLNALNEAILRASGDFGHLTTLNHPLKLSSDQLNRTSLLQHVADVGVALVLLVAFSLVAAQGARELVRERISEEKRILYLTGVHPVTYWTSTLVWDFLVFLCSIGCAVIVFEIFGLPAYVARDNLPGICIILVLFAWAAIPFTHLFEKMCNDASISNMVLFCVNTFIGVFCLATILIIDILGKSEIAENARTLIHNIMLIFPQYALGDALIRLSTNDIAAELLVRFNMNTYKSPLGWELIGPHYLYMFSIGLILYLINLAIECRIFPNWHRKNDLHENPEIQEDDDVIKERLRVEKDSSTDVIKTVKLRKEYESVNGKNIAIRNLSIGVQAGSCFGLLGVNGAGKSTTFKMLTTELRPTSGKIILKDKKLSDRPLCNGEIGYCPQSDALDGFLSPYQCLTIHGEVCGLFNVSSAVNSMLQRFDLIKYAHQRVSSLSGGNKRKLCAAISVMAPVSVVLMDEPTSGMDPASKELVARAVRQVIQSQGCVIMTSHSVAECEKLCSRVGILTKAGLRCIGTVQHLKHKFGEGYVAFIRFSQLVEQRELKAAISRYFPTAQMSSRQATAIRFLIPKNEGMLLSENFSRLKHLAEELKADDYTLTQSSLDQVMVNFSEEYVDEFSDSKCNSKGILNLANSCSSTDNIHMETF